jgi:hypothetical protein
MSASLPTSLGAMGAGFMSAMRPDRAATACTGSSANFATTAWSPRPRAFR